MTTRTEIAFDLDKSRPKRTLLRVSLCSGSTGTSAGCQEKTVQKTIRLRHSADWGARVGSAPLFGVERHEGRRQGSQCGRWATREGSFCGACQADCFRCSFNHNGFQCRHESPPRFLAATPSAGTSFPQSQEDVGVATAQVPRGTSGTARRFAGSSASAG